MTTNEEKSLENPANESLEPYIVPEKLYRHESYSFHRAQTCKERVVMGVDEAGRGPVLGPMVYAAAYCPQSYAQQLPESGFADSKTLDASTRSELMSAINSDPLRNQIGWAVRVMSARDISKAMLHHTSAYNLNAQAHDATIELVQSIIDSGIDVAELYVDTVGPPAAYEAKLAKCFPACKVTVSKKADSLYAIVSVASICAKVTRDRVLETSKPKDLETDWGSGYPSDPRTMAWLKESCDPLFGWDGIVRFSWQTARELVEVNSKAKVTWPVDEDDNPINNYFQPASICNDFFGRPVKVEGW